MEEVGGERREHEQEQAKVKEMKGGKKEETWIDGKSTAVISIGFLSQKLNE